MSDIERAVRIEARTFDDVKRLTRCGMGLCQGKTCQSIIAALIADLSSLPVAETFIARERMPLAPVVMEVLATAKTDERQEG